MPLSNRIPSPGRRRLLTIAALVLLVAATATLVVFAVPQTVGADTSYVVVSSSMSPAIHANDAIIVDDVPPSDVRVGDVIVFEAEADTIGADDVRVVTHRVIEVQETSEGLQFRTKGDALEEPDARPIPASDLVGRVSFTIPYVGYVVQFAGSDTGFLALVVVPFGLLILSELWNLFTLATGGEDEIEDEESVVAEPSLEE